MSPAPQPGLASRLTAFDTAARADRHDTAARSGRHDTAPADAIHQQVLSVVTSRICGSAAENGTHVDCLDALSDALATSETGFQQSLSRLRATHGVSDEEIVDFYIPAVACRLGEDWAENRRSFAEVTIGTARLIATVRDLSRRWTADAAADWRAPTIVMVVPEAEQHRLGAVIAASRFRRRGVSVHMLLGRTDAEVVAAVASGQYDMVSFSLATLDRVEHVRDVIQFLRERVSALPPIVVGGAIGMDGAELQARVGADHVVCDPDEALRLCGMTVPKRGAAAPAGL